MHTPDEFATLQNYEVPVTSEQLDLAANAWAAFRSPTPEDWVALVKQGTSALPFLHAAILRLLAEYPHHLNPSS